MLEVLHQVELRAGRVLLEQNQARIQADEVLTIP
jgi:hypothetical protein